MRYEKLLLTFAIVVVIAAAANLFITIGNVGDFDSLTGNVIGEANLTIESRASIDFISTVADWGAGQVDSGQTRATLTTGETVINGNWTDNVGPLVLENKGNTNVSLTLAASKNSTNFIGGTDPNFALIVNSSANNVSCATWVNYYNVSTEVLTTDAIAVCSDFNYLVGFDVMDINVNITIYEDAVPEAKTVIITAAAVPV